MHVGGFIVHVHGRHRKIRVGIVTCYISHEMGGGALLLYIISLLCFEEKNDNTTFSRKDPISRNSNPEQNQRFCTRHLHVYCAIKML